MRRAAPFMPWSDSMASSITLTGSRAAGAVPRHGIASQNQAQPNAALRRLVRELNASTMHAIPEGEHDDEYLSTSAVPQEHRHVQQSPALHPAAVNATTASPDGYRLNGSLELPADSGSLTTPHRRRRRDAVRAKLRRIAHLISYYLGLLAQDFSAAPILYSPLSVRMR